MARPTWQLMVGSLLVCAVEAGCEKTATTSDSVSESSGASAAVSGRAFGSAASVEGSGGGTADGTGGPGGSLAGGGHGVGTAPRVNPKEFTPSAGLRDIHFDFDRYTIRAEDTPILDANAEWLKGNPRTLLLIEGHADERGTNEYNLALGERRAKATRDYLVSVGIDAGRITVISYGEERPVCTEKNDACWAKNRRAHFLVKQ